MTMGYASAIRNAKLDLITTAIDDGITHAAGKLRLYNGARPATGAPITTQTVGAELFFSNPAAIGASSGLLTFSAIDDDTSADNSINPVTWGRILDRDDVFVADCSVGLSGTDVIINTLNIVAGVNVGVTDFASITDGNP